MAIVLVLPVTVEGMQLVSVETPEGLTSSTMCELAPDSVAVAVFRRA